jgi:hypothetical protein
MRKTIYLPLIFLYLFFASIDSLHGSSKKEHIYSQMKLDDPTVEELIYEFIEERKLHFSQFISAQRAHELVDSMKQELITAIDLYDRLLILAQTNEQDEYNLLKAKLATYDYELDSLDHATVFAILINQNTNGYLQNENLPCTEVAEGMVLGAIIVAEVGIYLSVITKGFSALVGTMISAAVLLAADDVYCKCMNDRYGSGGEPCEGQN